jgi:hypothetical protein
MSFITMCWSLITLFYNHLLLWLNRILIVISKDIFAILRPQIIEICFHLTVCIKFYIYIWSSFLYLWTSSSYTFTDLIELWILYCYYSFLLTLSALSFSWYLLKTIISCLLFSFSSSILLCWLLFLSPSSLLSCTLSSPKILFSTFRLSSCRPFLLLKPWSGVKNLCALKFIYNCSAL